MAIHDREFASRPATFDEFRWRLQYLAELGVGRLVRRVQREEDAEFSEALARARKVG